MSENILMKNIFITKVEKDDHRTIIEVCFENMHEPKYCRLFKATLEKENDGWLLRSIAVHDSRKDRFLIVGSLYAPFLYEEIKNEILLYISQDSMFEERVAQ